MLSRRAEGVTLIEMMVGLTIISCLLLVGMPSFTGWIQDLQVRGAAESIHSGLLLARSEAIRRNRPVQLTLANAGGLVEWQVGCVTVATDCPGLITQRKRGEGGLNTRMAAGAALAGKGGTALAVGAGLPASAVFNGLGQLGAAAPGRIEVSHVRLGSARRLVIRIDTGMARICKPQQDCA